MKRYRFLLAAALLVICISVCGCAHENPTDLLARLCSLYPEMPQVTVYFSEAENEGEGYLSANLASVMYTGNPDRSITMPSSYAIAMTDSSELFEIHIFGIGSGIDEASALKILNGRAELIKHGGLSEYDALQYYTTVENIETVKCRGFVCLLVTPDNERVKAELGIK